ncbi:MAG TPA: sortase [Patescibacteria group bacterium]|nr:sortase [Patescibacteria group bacterium]
MAKKRSSSKKVSPKKKKFDFRKFDPHKLSLGLIFLFLGLYIVVGVLRTFTTQKAVESGAVSASAFQNLGPIKKDQKEPIRVIIPTVSIDLSVQHSKIIAGYWQVFDDTAAWGEQSGYPGQPGNQVIFAHAREGLFLPLKDIKIGAKIYVMTDDKWFAYEVKEIKDVLPNQIEVIAPTLDETLTIYTCTGYQDSKRLIVTAKRI